MAHQCAIRVGVRSHAAPHRARGGRALGHRTVKAIKDCGNSLNRDRCIAVVQATRPSAVGAVCLPHTELPTLLSGCFECVAVLHSMTGVSSDSAPSGAAALAMLEQQIGTTEQEKAEWRRKEKGRRKVGAAQKQI